MIATPGPVLMIGPMVVGRPIEVGACSLRCHIEPIYEMTPCKSDVSTCCPRPVCRRARSAALIDSVAMYAVATLGAGVAVKTGPRRSNQRRSASAKVLPSSRSRPATWSAAEPGQQRASH